MTTNAHHEIGLLIAGVLTLAAIGAAAGFRRRATWSTWAITACT
jgi:hypothetical protein